VAIAQALPDAVDNGQGDRERVLGLAEVLPAEDVQFYYQMGLIGRRDLPLAPDPRSGFEMVLLRMLAFRPADTGDAPRVVLKPLGISQATADPTDKPVAGAVISPPVAPVATVPETLPAAVPEPSPAVIEDAPVAVPEAELSAAAEPAAEAPVADAAPATPEPEVEAPIPAPGPVIDLPWEEPAAPAVSAPEVAAASVSAPQADEMPVVAVASEEVPFADDEPPPGDYDYVEMSAEALDYDFEAVAPEQEAEPAPAAQPATGLAADWLELFPALGLSGMTGSIGANCTLVAVEGDRWSLRLDPGHSALFNPTQQRRLNDALNQHLGRAIDLQIELRTPEQETPAQAAARRRANRQREAETSIQSDPLVQQMIQQFGAVIRADSIEPFDPAVNP
jgi:DNA polymerase-3 subunit gamma/tau